MMDKIDKIFEVGKLPPIGVVPRKMHAWVLHTDTLGSVQSAFRDELIDVPKLKPNEVLVANMAAGINFNGIWAANGEPKNVLLKNGEYGDKKEEFHICGSESSGIVYEVGSQVKNVSVGDYVCLIGHRYDPDCLYVKKGYSTEYSPSAHIWGYESNWGAFAQFSKVYSYQCIKKPAYMSWEEASACTATGVTVYRMLNHWKGNQIKRGDVVLVWGAAGGLGTYAIKLAKAAGAVVVAVVSDDEKGEYCISLGAKGYINRKNYTHWGSISGLSEKEYKRWLISTTKFRNEIFEIVGAKKAPDIVVEHPGSDTIATSLLVCSSGGMVVLCGATSGYICTEDFRYLWIYQKRIQGSHGGNIQDCVDFMEFSEKYNIKPAIHHVYSWNQLPQAHIDLEEGIGIKGKLVIRIGLRGEENA